MLWPRFSPDTWTLDWALLQRPGNIDVQLDLFGDYRRNLDLYPQFQSMFRKHRFPMLIAWGKFDPFFTLDGARACLRDVPDTELHLLDTGHFALETHSSEIAALILDFKETSRACGPTHPIAWRRTGSRSQRDGPLLTQPAQSPCCVKLRRLKAVRRYEHDPASLRARVLLNCSHELTANPSPTRGLGHPQIGDVAAAAPGVSAYPGLNVTGAAFRDRSDDSPSSCPVAAALYS
jgi:hypothetical protein